MGVIKVHRSSSFAITMSLLVFAIICYLTTAEGFGSDPPRLLVDPSDLDVSFDGDGKVLTQMNFSTGNHYLEDMVLQPDGKILITGGHSAAGGAVVARYSQNGSLDTSFDSDGIVITTFLTGINHGYSIAVQADGKIIMAARTENGTGPSGWSLGIARYNPDGSLDTSFDGDGKVITMMGNFFGPSSIALQPDGKFVISGGLSDGVDTNTFFHRYNPNGSLDTTFDGDGKRVVEVSPHDDGSRKVAIQSDGKIVSAGYGIVERASNVFDDDYEVVRLNPDGSLDTTFDGDGIVITPIGPNLDRATDMALQPDEKIVLTGFTQDLSFNWDFATVRYNANGSLDTTFDGDGKAITAIGSGRDIGNSVNVQPNGKIVVGGTVREVDDDFGVVRYNSDGTLDTTFSGDGKVITPVSTGTDEAYAGVIQADGKIVLGGTWRGGPTMTGFALARYLGDALVARRSLFDFDGDGKTDISIFRPGVGEWWYLRSSDGGNRAFQFGAGTDVLVPADYTGDGKTDNAFYRNGEWFVQRSSDFSFYSFPFGNSTDTPAPADYDGDGKADPAVFRASTGQWYINRSSDGQVTVTGFGNATDRPVPADLDGDGKTDIAVYRPVGTSGMSEWWYLRSSDGGNRAFAFGQSTDKAVAGDYTGDGKADIAFFRPSTGVWFVLRSEDSSFYSFPFGIETDLPAPGDYDGDGKTDPAVFRPSDTNWYVQRSTAGILIQQFGAPTDKPIPGVYVR